MFGGSTNYIGTIIVVIVFVVVLSYLIWKPYLRGQKVHAVVDGHVHPVSGDVLSKHAVVPPLQCDAVVPDLTGETVVCVKVLVVL